MWCIHTAFQPGFAKRRKLAGRARFSVSVVRELFNGLHTNPDTKYIELDKVSDSAIGLTKTEPRSKVRDLIDSDKTGETVRLFGRMVLAFKLQDGKIWFARIGQADFVDKALCGMKRDYDGVHWTMDELPVVEVVEEELKRLKVGSRLFRISWSAQWDHWRSRFRVNSQGNCSGTTRPTLIATFQQFFILWTFPFFSKTSN